MKIFFGCTSQQIELYYQDYKRIRDYLIDQKQIITFDWLDNAFKSKQLKSTKRNIGGIFSKLMKAIDEADAVVLEATVANFSVAHQIFYAIKRKKPLLILWKKMDNEPYADSYLDVFKSPITWIEKYNNENMEKVINRFLAHFQKNNFGGRYNIVLDGNSRYYLDYVSQKTGKSRSAIIRDLLEKMSLDDQEFQDL